MASPSGPVPEHDPEHEPRAVAAIARAVSTIPFYAKNAARWPAPQPGARLVDALAKLPLLFKHDIRPTLPKQWVPPGRDAKAELTSGEIELVETSGSTGDRTRILWDKGWWLRQEERAFRTHPVIARSFAGKTHAYNEAILTTPVCGLGSCHAGDMTVQERTDEFRLFLNTKPDPTFWKPEDTTRILDELTAHETAGLESDPMYLATLARFAAAAGRRIDVKDFIVLTYAFASKAHERLIRRAYEGPLLNLYGASEVGVLFMEGEDGRLHHCPLTTHVELLPIKVATPGAKNVALAVVTTVDRVVQPLVRFVVGDLVSVDAASPSKFTTVPPLASVEGRVTDAIVRPDGAIVTAGAIDRALAPAVGIAIYQANQPAHGQVHVDVVSDAGDAVVAEAESRLLPLFAGMELKVRSAAAIAAEPSGKFRVARRHFPIAMGSLFDGCEGVML